MECHLGEEPAAVAAPARETGVLGALGDVPVECHLGKESAAVAATRETGVAADRGDMPVGCHLVNDRRPTTTTVTLS